MKYYIIRYENGAIRTCEFSRREYAENYAESNNGGWSYKIEEYDDYNEYIKAI